MILNWEDGYEIRVMNDGASAVISANRAGLLSLAGILSALADETPGAHVHLDEYNALEDGSLPLIVEKTGDNGR
ncbi:MAG: hypothetical protein IJK02_05425 [Clostridia bacterium]|nr:hypothetical protein [Clostridia bacterium]MBR0538144.1 hypothetical protein [Clostridia bacterium]